jgi:hypothetical protein
MLRGSLYLNPYRFSCIPNLRIGERYGSKSNRARARTQKKYGLSDYAGLPNP